MSASSSEMAEDRSSASSEEEEVGSASSEEEEDSFDQDKGKDIHMLSVADGLWDCSILYRPNYVKLSVEDREKAYDIVYSILKTHHLKNDQEAMEMLIRRLGELTVDGFLIMTLELSEALYAYLTYYHDTLLNLVVAERVLSPHQYRKYIAKQRHVYDKASKKYEELVLLEPVSAHRQSLWWGGNKEPKASILLHIKESRDKGTWNPLGDTCVRLYKLYGSK